VQRETIKALLNNLTLIEYAIKYRSQTPPACTPLLPRTVMELPVIVNSDLDTPYFFAINA